MSKAEPWMIASDLSGAVVRAVRARGGESDDPPIVTTSAACNDLCATAHQRAALLRAQTRALVSSHILASVTRAVDARNKTVPAPKALPSATPEAVQRVATMATVARALQDDHGLCEAVERAVTRRRKMLAAQVNDTVLAHAGGCPGARSAAVRRQVARELAELEMNPSNSSDMTRAELGQFMLNKVVAPVVMAVETAVQHHHRSAAAGMDHMCAVVGRNLSASQSGPALRHAVAATLSQEVDLFSLQLKAADAFHDVSQMGISLVQPPEWMLATHNRPRTPQSLPPLDSQGSAPGTPTSVALSPAATVAVAAPMISSPSPKMSMDITQVEHLTGRLRDPPARPAAALLSGTRHVPHSKISPFTGFYQSWQYEKRDSPTKFDKRKQFEHMHRCVKYCLTNSPLPDVLPKVPPWEEDGADMSLQSVNRPTVTSKAPGWDATKVHGMDGHRSLAELQDENLPTWVFDKKPLPVLGVQEHGRQLANRGL